MAMFGAITLNRKIWPDSSMTPSSILNFSLSTFIFAGYTAPAARFAVSDRVWYSVSTFVYWSVYGSIVCTCAFVVSAISVSLVSAHLSVMGYADARSAPAETLLVPIRDSRLNPDGTVTSHTLPVAAAARS